MIQEGDVLYLENMESTADPELLASLRKLVNEAIQDQNVFEGTASSEYGLFVLACVGKLRNGDGYGCRRPGEHSAPTNS